MKFHFNSHHFKPTGMVELYELDSSYRPLVDFVRKWIRGDSHYEFYTSGSTGRPGRVVVSRNQILASVNATAEHINLRSGENILLCLSPNYIASLMMAVRGLILDLDVYIVKPTSNPLMELNGQQVDFGSFVPLQIYNIIESGQIESLSKIRNVLIGGAPITNDAFEQLAKLPNNLFMTYGMTETVTHIALMPIKGDPKEATYKLLPNLYIQVNENRCLSIKGEVTDNKTVQTMDVVELINPREFKWLGRKDYMINSGGVKIHPEQIEKVISDELQKLHIENEFYVAGVADPILNQRLVLYVEGEFDQSIFPKLIQPAIEIQFDKYHVPKELIVMDRFERTESGKVKRI